jgi:RimJ/RimL family protein N-acetyltransferase
LIPEAVRVLLRHCFVDIGLSAIWCGYYDGNEKSKRAQEKCGFRYHHTEHNKPCLLMGDIRTEHFSRLCREEWKENSLRL